MTRRLEPTPADLADIFDAFEKECIELEKVKQLTRTGREIFCNAVCHMQNVYVRTPGISKSSVPEEGFAL